MPLNLTGLIWNALMLSFGRGLIWIVPLTLIHFGLIYWQTVLPPVTPGDAFASVEDVVREVNANRVRRQIMALLGHVATLGATALVVLWASGVIGGDRPTPVQWAVRLVCGLVPLLVLVAAPLAAMEYLLAVLHPNVSLILVPAYLYLSGALLVILPVTVIERAGFAGWRRSFELTRPHRWRLVGLVLVVHVGAYVVQALYWGLIGPRYVFGADRYLLMMLSSALFSAKLVLVGIVVTVIHARLREIEQGISARDATEVFA